MPPRPRYLTKSRYKLALECPTKLFYTGKPKAYADASVDDPFLMALARGGYQVGALAQCYFPGGIEVTSKSHVESVAETEALLQQETVTIFEAAIQSGILFARVDILEKRGNKIRLIEVKAKSFDPTEELPFFHKKLYEKNRIKLKDSYDTYIYDVAFQTHVLSLAHAEFEVSSHLMLTDKSTVTSVDGLNQLFLLKKSDNGRSYCEIKPGLTPSHLGTKILRIVNVDEAVTAIFTDKEESRDATVRYRGLSFQAEVQAFATAYVNDERLSVDPGKHCKKCEFRTKPNTTLKSGFDECWSTSKHLSSADLSQPFVFDIWNFTKSDNLIGDGKVLMREVCLEDIKPKTDADKPGLSQSERQWLQVEFHQSARTAPHVDVAGLKAAMSAWKFPLHFIDFETAMVAIPFNKGCRPYQTLAFQFSHHIVHQDGRIEHADQFLHDGIGVFPNFDFVRALKKSLSADDGTIFRYAPHENTVLCQIFEQLKASSEPDKNELTAWIRTVTKSTVSSSENWIGPRNMVDLWELTKSFYYHPQTNGSVSIKKVLPAILSDSEALRTRFARPIYGSSEVPSRNFKQWPWIQFDGTRLRDPYELLPSVYGELSPEQLDKAMCDDELADGGAAMTAYAMMQFTEMSDAERQALREALLKYCELDTFAMVLLYEYWNEFVSGGRVPKAA